MKKYKSYLVSLLCLIVALFCVAPVEAASYKVTCGTKVTIPGFTYSASLSGVPVSERSKVKWYSSNTSVLQIKKYFY